MWRGHKSERLGWGLSASSSGAPSFAPSFDALPPCWQLGCNAIMGPRLALACATSAASHPRLRGAHIEQLPSRTQIVRSTSQRDRGESRHRKSLRVFTVSCAANEISMRQLDDRDAATPSKLWHNVCGAIRAQSRARTLAQPAAPQAARCSCGQVALRSARKGACPPGTPQQHKPPTQKHGEKTSKRKHESGAGANCPGDQAERSKVAKIVYERHGASWRARASVDPRLTGRGERVTWLSERPMWHGGGFALGCSICAGALAKRRQPCGSRAVGKATATGKKGTVKAAIGKSRPGPRGDVRWARYEIDRLTDCSKALAAISNHAASEVHRRSLAECFSAQSHWSQVAAVPQPAAEFQIDNVFQGASPSAFRLGGRLGRHCRVHFYSEKLATDPEEGKCCCG